QGQFPKWVEFECGINKRTAQRMMLAAEWAEGKSDTVTLLPPTLLYLLSSSRTPAETRDAILARIGAGRVIEAGAMRREIAKANTVAPGITAKTFKPPERK